MVNEYEWDMIYKIIWDHLITKGNLDPEQIQEKIRKEKITLELSLVVNRIDEFKKSKAYRDHNAQSQDIKEDVHHFERDEEEGRERRKV